MARYYICGQNGSGTEADPYRPEIADEIPAGFGWAANQEFATLTPVPLPVARFLVHVAAPVAAVAQQDYATEAEYQAALTQAQADAQAALDAWHAEVAYDKATNPNGYDWLDVAEDGTVKVNAA